MKTAVFTIVSNNYSAQARVLCQSLKIHQSEWDRFVLVVDEPLPESLITEEEASTVYVSELSLPLPNWFFFQYSVMEANTAVKPWMFERLFDAGYDAVVYLDPDIKIYSPLQEIDARLQDQTILLTPHITEPYNDGFSPGETHIRRAGIYNLGFAAMRQSPLTRNALSWWLGKLTHDCRSAQDEGIFVDQSWMDFAPCFYGAYLLTDPAYNIAYWNLHERPLQVEGFPGTAPTCKGKPVGFIHFSGFDYRKPLALSKHQNRFHAGNLPHGLAPVLKEYAQSLRDNGIVDSEKFSYRLHSLDGLMIPDFLRAELVQKAPVRAMVISNTPTAGLSARLLDFCCSRDPKIPTLPIFLGRLYAARRDLRAHFVGCDHGLSIPHFVQWFEKQGRKEYDFDPAFPSSGWWDRESGWKRWKRQVAENFAKGLLKWNWSQREAFLLALSRLRKSLRNPKLSKFKPFPVHHRENLRINLYGYFLAKSGMGEVARSTSRALTHLGVAHQIINLDHGGRWSPSDLPLTLPDSKAQIDIVAVNVDSFEAFLRQYPSQPGKRHYRVGYWLWEMDSPPPGFSRVEKLVDEIWCASGQNAETFRKDSQRIVRVAGLNLSRQWEEIHPFPFPELSLTGRFVFVTFCDCLSHPERKNPVLALKAYLAAFPRESQDALMIVKMSNGHCRPDTLKQLHELAAGRKDVFIPDVELPIEGVIGLMQSADCLISLHAQEGFGLPIAEAIALGKKVVATAYGGNMDFCTPENSYLVPFKLYQLEENVGPYLKGNTWAQPDVKAAANYLRHIYSNRKTNSSTLPSPKINEICYRQMAANIAAIEEIIHP